jgi:nickel-dependent lactate racemase
MLPPVLDELNRAGVPDKDVMVVFGLGSHRPHTPEEHRQLVGPDIADRVTCIDPVPDQMVYVGTTSRGTPIEAFRPVVEADVRIALANVEPHYFAGYSGGNKSLVPGICSLNTIKHNHAMMVDPQARTGLLDGNPVREDLEEGAALIGLDFILNVILGENHQIVAAAAGHPIQAHRWACQVVEHLSITPVHQLADLVIVGAGGYPKDINMYQAQKALDNAAAAVRPGGVIIWVAECPEGLGHATFEKWILNSSPDEILDRIQTDFELGGHKAAAIASVLKRAQVFLVSALPAELVTACGLTPHSSIQSALEAAFQLMGPEPVVMVMPEGASIVPVLQA